MDYPISVPSVGLVGGKFVDEDPLVGTPGSLIPAQWGNAVTDEILHVITVAGLTPDESLNTQLATAISQLVGSRLPFSSPVIGAVRNLRCSVPAASATAPITADEVVMKSMLGGMSYVVPNFSRAIDLSKVGVGGMDNGGATANGFLGIYACFNPNIAVSPTNPMLIGKMEASAILPAAYGGLYMPAGYTASALVSVAPISAAAGQFAPFFQVDRTVDYLGVGVLTSSTAVGGPFARASTGFPYSAKFVSGFNQAGSSAASSVSQVLTSVSNSAIGGQFNTATLPGGSVAVPFRVAISVPQTIYQTASSTGGIPSFTISVKNYEF
ncbi:MAG: hypothetical protein WCC61_15150 [Pseudomonas sp.]|uniref:hypothetical protein n=1 Tax=Pseudomonas sp. TaxID=306 RepID=UPI003C7DD7CC